MRRRDPFKSESEAYSETLRRVIDNGRANLSQAAIILRWSQPRVRANVDRGDVDAVKVNQLRYIPLEELERILGRSLRKKQDVHH